MENNDSVCFIGKISKIVPIIGADKIELATINGWNSIVSKAVHNSEDLLVLCITTDAIIPEDFATKFGVKQYLRKGNRVRTVKLKGVYSECILIPVKELFSNVDELKEGSDWMSTFGIYKYEEPVNNHTGQGKGQPRSNKNRINENFNKYHKFPNIKNVPGLFKDGDPVVITRKIHGSNARYGILRKSKITIWDRLKKLFGNKYAYYEYVYGSHNVQKGTNGPGYYKTDVWADVAERQNIKASLWSTAKELIDIGTLGKGIVVHGEIFGPGIQGDKYNYNKTEVEFVAFDIELDDIYLSHDEFEVRAGFDCGMEIPTVEVLYDGPWSQAIQDKCVLNQYIDGTDVPHEGIVVACPSGSRDRIAKVINPEYHTHAEKFHVPDGH